MKSSISPRVNVIRKAPSTTSSLFQSELNEIYWTEKALTIAIPEMINNANSEEQKKFLEVHLQNARDQVEQIRSMLGKEPEVEEDQKMHVIVEEAKELMKEGIWCYEKAVPPAPRFSKVNTRRFHRDRYTRTSHRS
jgi:hypothetical protein